MNLHFNTAGLKSKNIVIRILRETCHFRENVCGVWRSCHAKRKKGHSDSLQQVWCAPSGAMSVILPSTAPYIWRLLSLGTARKTIALVQ